MQARMAKSQYGYTLIEMMMTISIIAGVSLLTSQLMIQVSASNRTAEIQSTLSTLRDNYVAILNDDILPVGTAVPSVSALWNTIATVGGLANPSMNCLRTGGNCAGVNNQPFTPLMRNGQPYMGYRPTAFATHGFRRDGTLCNTYVAPPGAASRDCHIRVNFTWSAICPAGACPQPEVDLAMTFQVNFPPQTTNVINVERYNVRIRKMSESAGAAGATGTCPAGQFSTGFGATGQPTCTN